MPRKREIEAAVAAYKAIDDRETLLLPPDAVRLLAVMFPRGTIFRGSAKSLQAKGFDRGTLRKLLISLIAAGFLSKELARRGITLTYRLHLPPRVQS